MHTGIKRTVIGSCTQYYNDDNVQIGAVYQLPTAEGTWSLIESHDWDGEIEVSDQYNPRIVADCGPTDEVPGLVDKYIRRPAEEFANADKN